MTVALFAMHENIRRLWMLYFHFIVEVKSDDKNVIYFFFFTSERQIKKA